MTSTIIALTPAALANVQESGCDPQTDIAALRSGEHTAESLLAHCLDGADADRVAGWREYVEAVVAASGVTSTTYAPRILTDSDTGVSRVLLWSARAQAWRAYGEGQYAPAAILAEQGSYREAALSLLAQVGGEVAS